MKKLHLICNKAVWSVRHFFLIVLGFLLANTAYALTQTRTPTSSWSDCTSVSGVGTKSWSKPYRAYLSDNSYSTASVDGTTSKYLQCLNYGFTIPASATINGITVTVDRKSSRTSDGGSRDAAMRIVKAGSIGSTDRSTATLYTTSEVSEAHGGAADLWGLSWTAAEINAANFGAAFAATKPSSAGKSHKISVDQIQITVTYTTDTTPPIVSSINRVNATPTGNTSVAWTVLFSESVTGVDAADFSLIQAGGVSGASITSVTGSGTTWTVTVNTGSGSGTLGLNLVDNDTIIDASSNKLGGAGAGNGNFTGQVYAVDKVNPLINSINRAGSDPTIASSVSWTAIFSESVTGVDAGDFALVQAGGVSGASITSVSGSGTTWTVTASTGSGSGTLGLNLVDNDTIIDSTGHYLMGGTGAANGNYTGEVYTIDRTPPAVSSINRAEADPSDNPTVSWTVVFSESVTGVDASDFSLAASGLSGAYLMSVTGSGTTWTVVANTGICSGTCTLGLNLVDDDTVVDGIGNKLGGTGAGNGNFTGQVYSISTPPLAGYGMDEAWNGTTDEVIDSTGNFPGTAANSATTQVGDTGTCRYGVFDSATITKGAVTLPDLGIDVSSDFTITAWIRTTSNTTANQRIFTDDDGTSNSYGLSLGDGGTGKLRFYVTGSSVVNLDTSNVIANNTWYYVAGVANIANGQRTIYVFDAAGSLLTSATTAVTGAVAPTGPPGTPTISAPTSSNHFKGNLDELRIYDKALSQAALTTLALTTHACASAGPNHYVIAHSGTGLTCEAEPVTITAHDGTHTRLSAGGKTVSLSTSSSKGVWSAAADSCSKVCYDAAGTVVTCSGTFTATGSNVGTATYLFGAGEAAVRLCLKHDTTGTVNLNITDGTATESSGAASTETTPGADPSIVFSDSGFRFYANGSVDTLGNLVAGLRSDVTDATYQSSPQTLTISALKNSQTTPARCVSLVASGARTIQFAYQCIDPSSCHASSAGLEVNGTAVAGSGSVPTPASNVSVVFDASGYGAINLEYWDVGQIKLYASGAITNPATGGAVGIASGASNAFLVKPHSFSVMACTSAAPCTTANAYAPADGSGTVFSTAGAAFNATVKALAYGGSVVTPSFGLGSANGTESVMLSRTLVVPSGGAAGALGGTTSILRSSFSSGVASVTDLTWSEVGVITLSASNSSFEGTALSPTATGSSGNIGRFKPDHFAITLPTLTSLIPACSTGTTPFTYFGQDGFTTAFTLTAQSVSNSTTTNYAGSGGSSSWAKLPLTAWGAAPASTGSPGFGFAATWSPSQPAGASLAASATTPTGVWAAGTAAVTAKHQVVRPTAAAAPTTLTVSSLPVDSDGVTVATATTIGSPLLRFGRLWLGNVYGSDRLPLSMPYELQYWNGFAFVVNRDDSCTSIAKVNIGLDNFQPSTPAPGFAPSMTLANIANGPFVAIGGRGSIAIAKPVATGSPVSLVAGSVDLVVGLGSSGSPSNCGSLSGGTPASPSLAHLSGKWCGSNYDRDPTARATFGVFGSSLRKGPIYIRENF